MKDAKPIFWINAPYYDAEHLMPLIDRLKESMPDYHVAITFHGRDEAELKVLNGQELTEEKYNELMEALKK